MRIGIVEDQAMFRQMIRRFCEREWKLDVVVEVGTMRDAVRELVRYAPSLVLLDLYLPDLTGFQIVEQVGAQIPDMRFLALSGYCDDMTVINVLKSGIHGFVNKSHTGIQEIREAIGVLANGGIYFSKVFQEKRLAQLNDPHFFAKILSDRELEVLSLVGIGKGDAEISERLGISLRTVEKYKSNVLHKLRLENTTKMMVFAIEHGLAHRV